MFGHDVRSLAAFPRDRRFRSFSHLVKSRLVDLDLSRRSSSLAVCSWLLAHRCGTGRRAKNGLQTYGGPPGAGLPKPAAVLKRTSDPSSTHLAASERQSLALRQAYNREGRVRVGLIDLVSKANFSGRCLFALSHHLLRRRRSCFILLFFSSATFSSASQCSQALVASLPSRPFSCLWPPLPQVRILPESPRLNFAEPASYSSHRRCDRPVESDAFAHPPYSPNPPSLRLEPHLRSRRSNQRKFDSTRRRNPSRAIDATQRGVAGRARLVWRSP